MVSNISGMSEDEFLKLKSRDMVTVQCECGIAAPKLVSVATIRRLEKKNEPYRCRSCGISKAHKTYAATDEGKAFYKRLGKIGNAASTYRTTSEVAKQAAETKRKNGFVPFRTTDKQKVAYGRGAKYFVVTNPITEEPFIVQGSYELAYACYLLANKVEFESHCGKLPYFDEEGIQREYHPDFYVPSLNIYVEIKSDYTLGIPGVKQKYAAIKALGHNLLVLSDSQLEKLGVL